MSARAAPRTSSSSARAPCTRRRHRTTSSRESRVRASCTWSGRNLGSRRSIDRTELCVADEVFLCGTGAQVAPVIDIDRRRVGDGEPGPVTMRIQDLYNSVVTGRVDKYAEWLTPVYG